MWIEWVYLLCLFNFLDFANGADPADLIADLPDYNGSTLNFKQYSGYLELVSGNALFYWLTQSPKQSDPVILWLSGGPGCSSTFALMTEMGPYRLENNGQSLSNNVYAWNQYAHMIYMDAPAGVGFSLNRIGQYNFTDSEVAYDNVEALVKFFKKFPELASNDLYIAGESYGGTYVPMLGSLIVRMKLFPNFKGILVGNGCLHEKLRYNTQIPFNHNHDFISEETYQSSINQCCSGKMAETCDWHSLSKKIGSACQETADKLEEANFYSGLDPYFIYYACYLDQNSTQANLTPRNMNFGFRRSKSNSEKQTCVRENDSNVYLNRADVKKALHVSTDLNFTSCSQKIAEQYIVEYEDMGPFLNKIISDSSRRALFFNGDADTVCTFVHNQKFLNQLGLELVSEREAWNYANKVPKVSGYATRYKGVDFVTIAGAGHFASSQTEKPRETLQVFVNFLRSQNYSTPV